MGIAKRNFVSPIDTREVINRFNEIHKWAKFRAVYHEPYSEWGWSKYNTAERIKYIWDQYYCNSSNTYYWNKYSVASNTTYYWNKYSVASSTVYKWYRAAIMYKLKILSATTMYFAPSVAKSATKGSEPVLSSLTQFTQSTSTYDITANPSGYIGSWLVYSGSSPVRFANFTAYDGFKYAEIHGANAYTYTAHLYEAYMAKSTQKDIVRSSSSSAYPNDGQSGNYWYEYIGTEVQYSKGSTSYGRVSSSSSSTYPNGGKSGSYWYDGKTSSTSYSKGSTSYGTVASESSSAYPDNRKFGSYWYVYKESTTQYSKGNYVKERSVYDQPDLFPSNGRYTDGYWYVYKRSEVEYFKGATLIGFENARIDNAYPLDGKHTDGYWYVRVSRTDYAETYTQGEWIEDVQSNNPNEYPADGRHSDGFWYRKLV